LATPCTELGFVSLGEIWVVLSLIYVLSPVLLLSIAIITTYCEAWWSNVVVLAGLVLAGGRSSLFLVAGWGWRRPWRPWRSSHSIPWRRRYSLGDGNMRICFWGWNTCVVLMIWRYLRVAGVLLGVVEAIVEGVLQRVRRSHG
jgi:hypothetical protein